jgi:hypothetical protein
MSDTSQGEGWWLASDGKWYPPESAQRPTPPPPPYAQPQVQQTNGLAIASLVLGILWLYWVGSILALIFGYRARRQIDESNGAQGGRGLAIAGIVLGWIGVALLVLGGLAVLAIGVLGEEADTQFRQVGESIQGP